MTDFIATATTADQFQFPNGNRPSFFTLLLQRFSEWKANKSIEIEHIPTHALDANLQIKDNNSEDILNEGLDIFRRDLGLISNNLTGIADGMGGSASQLLEASEASATQVKEMSNEFDMTAKNMQKTMQQATGSVESITNSMSGMNEKLHEARDMTHEAALLSSQSREKIELMVHASNAIGDVVTLIHGIAEQTRMLSMNATIESVKAGEAGDGFKVIANEVKILAARTAAATADISTAIKDIRNHSHGAASAALAIAESVEHINQLTDHITQTAGEQVQVAEHITRDISAASDEVQHMSKGIGKAQECADDARMIAQEMNQGACNLHASIDELGQLTITHLGIDEQIEEEEIELF